MPGYAALDVARSPAPTRHVVETALTHGVDAQQCLSGSGLALSDLSDPATSVRPEQELMVIRNVVSRLGDSRGLGAEAGSRYSLADTGVLGYALMASRSFGDAVEVACRYFSFTATYFSLTAPAITETEASISFDHSGVPGDLRTFLIERDVAVLLRLLPALLGPLDSPVGIRLELSGVELPAVVAETPNLVLTVQHSTRNALNFPIALLHRPMPVSDPQTAAICIRQCEDLLNRRRVRRGTSAAVRTRIIQNSSDIPSMAMIAADFHMTERTLHRKLAAEGTSYRALLDETRTALAIEMLDSGLTVEETARRLGYSETAAFTRAYTRWSGHPPSRRNMATS
ncbi:MAG: AraC family transcriptional regulator ligand-binding domain-containing protein [Mycobacterium sp.]